MTLREAVEFMAVWVTGIGIYIILLILSQIILYQGIHP